jgi:hypothetical protein
MKNRHQKEVKQGVNIFVKLPGCGFNPTDQEVQKVLSHDLDEPPGFQEIEINMKGVFRTFIFSFLVQYQPLSLVASNSKEFHIFVHVGYEECENMLNMFPLEPYKYQSNELLVSPWFYEGGSLGNEQSENANRLRRNFKYQIPTIAQPHTIVPFKN